MRISDAGLRFIKAHEGLRLEAYPDPGTGGKPWTIGYGHTGPEVVPGLRITAERAEELLRANVARFEAAVTRLVRVPLSQPQFDALVSFAFNTGEGALARSTLLKMLNAGDYSGAAEQFDKWVNAGGKPMPGLIRRRRAERTMFESAPALPSLHGTIPTIPVPQKTETPMAPALAALLPFLPNLIPALGKIIGSGSPVSDRNVAALTKASEVVVEALGAPNLQAAVDTMSTDPAARLRASEAVQANWFQIVEAGGGGIDGARKFNVAVASAEPWKMPAVWISTALLALVFMVVGTVLWAEGWSNDIRLQVVTATLTIIGMVGSFWLGTSASSARKDDALFRSADR
jgi:lysozyme